MTRRPPTTVLELVQARTGSLRKTFQVGKVIAQWAIVRQDLGRRPYVHEYADWWKVSERTAWREMARFADAFPEEDGPDRLALLVLAAAPDRLTEATALSLPIAGVAAPG